MTPEQQKEIYEWYKNMQSASTIPLSTDQAITGRFLQGVNLTVSAKGTDTEDQAVSEGGSALYNVPREYDGFLQITINGTIYYIGIYT
jgi:hypothetical protein